MNNLASSPIGRADDLYRRARSARADLAGILAAATALRLQSIDNRSGLPSLQVGAAMACLRVAIALVDDVEFIVSGDAEKVDPAPLWPRVDSPLAHKPLSDAELDELWIARANLHGGDLQLQLRDFARAIERRHAIVV